ncbi:MAG: hypothetical protein NVSMB52_07120 [Chloroflexota bacterium]
MTSVAETFRTHDLAPVSGWKGDNDYFRFVERHDGYDPSVVLDVLHGKVAGVVFRKMVQSDTCARVAEAFWNSPDRRLRGKDVPGSYIGAFHYLKTTQHYLDDSAEASPALLEIVKGRDNPLQQFWYGLTEALKVDDAMYRLAEHHGRKACPGVIRSWHGEGAYALLPHEDLSQCCDPKQADFEVQSVTNHEVAALNMCLENGSGGRLAIWNIKPDEATRRRLNTYYTGIPYPLETLQQSELLWIDLNPGDVYVFNGSLVHAVESSLEPNSRRTTLSAIFGFVDDRTVVSWT